MHKKILRPLAMTLGLGLLPACPADPAVTTATDTDEATSPRTGYQGPLVACSVDYQPVSGHFTGSEMTSYLADTSRIIVWYSPLGASGYFVPYRVIIGTSMGDMSMVLTSARAQ